MIVDGKEIAREILARTKERATALGHAPRVVAITGSETPATRSYLAIKKRKALDAGCVFETREVGSDTSDADAVIIQLPLEGADLESIPLEKDADVLSKVAREKFERGEAGALLPPVVAAIKEIFDLYEIDVKDKKAVVVGEGWLVGRPAATWLGQQGAEVTVVNSKTVDLAAALRAADIIISGAGVPGLIKSGMIHQGLALIDAATSESNGIIAGDADPECASKCSLFTTVPGGVGPIAVACLFENAVTLAGQALAERTQQSMV